MRRGAFCLTLLLLAGCTGTALPRTHPAGGSVLYKDGMPMTGGSIQFNSLADPELRVIGTIGSDGSFTLATLKENTRADGAPEGDYKVLVFPPLSNESGGDAPAGHKGVPPIALDKTYRIEAKENTLKIELPTSAPKS
jgi:hypothetical protein